MPARPYILAETNWKQVQAAPYEVAVLPWGATEAHNYHLPYATDVIESDFVAAEAARRAWERGVRVMVLPTVPFGVNTGQLDIPGCINMNPSTQAAVLHDVIDSLDRQGIHKLLILNGHGGNNFKQMIRELIPMFPDTFLCTASWYQVLDNEAYFVEPGDHGGELETSMVMHIAPDLVQPLDAAGDGRSVPFKLKGLREKWVWSQRAWAQATVDTGVGNPAQATPEKGETYIAAVSEKLAGFLVELAAADLDNLYES